MNSITFYSNPLSSVNPSDLSPVLLSVNSSSSIETFISPLIPQLPLNSNSLFSRSLLSSLSSRQSPNLIQSLFCACGGLSSQDLQCKHKICSTCALQGFCNFCNSKLPSYSNSSRHPCLSCSVTRVQRLDCPHYCLTCLKRKLRSTEKFSCLICCLTFHKTEIETLKAVCSKCLTLSNTFFELSCGCLSCQDCLIQVLKQKKCLKCEESLEFKELLKLKKGLKFRCLLCFNLKSKKYFTRRCCSAKICRKCEDGSTRCCKCMLSCYNWCLNMSEEESGASNIRVICRFRPVNDRERINYSEKTCMDFVDSKTVQMTSSYENGSPLSFTFDHAFPPSAAQVDVYNVSAKPIVESVMQGFNGTVLAYGQTSSGKTFTMTGPDMNDGEMMGVIPRMVSTVFDQIESSDPKIEFQVKVGYCEIYLERIKDLLDTSKVNLKVHEDRARGIYIAELTEDYVSSRDEVYHLMRLGSSNREVGYTQMNSGSSRSHSIFILTVTQTSLTDLATKTGKLFLVDLAGSEKVGKTGAEGKRLEEAKNINKSLTMLGNVITALTDGKSSHVPYRDSKLTRVLQDSLGGNSKTTLIVTCSPSPFNEAETISTLRFGVRAKSIKNKPKVNREYSVNELKLMLAQAKEEISKKDRIIAALKKGQGNVNEDPLISKQSNFEDADENSSDEKSEKDSPSSEMYSQVMIELDYLQQKLSETESTLRKYRSLAEDFEDENLQMKEDHVFIYKQVADLQNKLIQTEESVAQLNIENESLKNELIVEIEKKFKLENELVEKNSQLIEANNDIIQTVKQEKAKITGLLEEEKLKNAELNKDIERMTQELKQNMKNMNEDNKLKLLELNYQTDRERWDKERISLQNQIKHGASQVISLQIQLEESSKIFKNLENTMSEGERHTKKVNDQLKRNLEQLNLMYHNLLSSSSQHKVNRAIAEKKATRLQDRLTLAEKALKDMSEKFLNSEKEVSSLKFNLHELEITNKCLSSGFAVSGNIRKVIRGGGDLVFKPNRRTNSAIPETSLTEENEDD